MLLNKIAVATMILSFSAFAAENVDEQVPQQHEQLVQLELQKIQLEKRIAELKHSQKKQQSKDERKAEERVTKEEKKLADRKRQQAQAEANAGLTGCNPGTVFVDPSATGSWSFQAYAKVRAINPMIMPVNITDPLLGREVVHNLCPGGAVTLYKKIDFFRDSNTVTYQYVATGTFPDGSVGIAQSPFMYLSQYQTSYQNGQNTIWTIQLQKYIPQK